MIAPTLIVLANQPHCGPSASTATATAAGFFDINVLGDMTSVGTLAAFAVVCLAVIWLRRTHPELPRGFKVPLYPVLPALGIVSCLALIFQVEGNVLQFFGIYTVVAVVLYFLYGMRNSELHRGRMSAAPHDLPAYKEDAPNR